MLRKYALLLTLIISLCQIRLHAQQDNVEARHRFARQALGMSESEYKMYNDSLHYYDQQIKLRLGTGDKQAILSKEIADLMTSRRLFVQRHITPEQAIRLHEHNIMNRPKKYPVMSQKEIEKRLKKKGIKVNKTAN